MNYASTTPMSAAPTKLPPLIRMHTSLIESVPKYQQSLQLSNQKPSAEELSIILRRFVGEWEQNVILGDHRWERENMMTMQRASKRLSTDLARLGSTHREFSDTNIEEMQPLLIELREFEMVDLRGPSIQEFEPVLAHGRKAYEMARGLTSVRTSFIEANEMSWCLCGHSSEIHNGAVCLFSYNNEGFPFDIDSECPSFRET